LENHLVVRAKGLTKTYRQGHLYVEALRGVNLEAAAGSYTVILGPSGGGKSTLLHLLGGIDRPTTGSLQVLGKSLEEANEVELTRFRRDHIGFIFQFYNLIPSLNALDNVILPLLAKGLSWKEARKHGQVILGKVGLDGRQKHTPGELSGGEQQRVAIARALIVEPGLILADEPTGDLDSASAEEVVKLMVQLNQEQGTTFIIATHNKRLCKEATSIYEMRDGILRLCETANQD
jgi:ABC-type lipoprotein export system ATPase subunit